LNRYLDASVLVALFTADAWTARARRWIADETAGFVVSDFAAAELASAVARKVRMRALTAAEAGLAFDHFDLWAARHADRAEATPVDTATAAAWLRSLEPSLRTPDALNLAVARRLGTSVVTFDSGMLRAAHALDVEAMEP
jgi:uncharacterized protein